MAEKNVENQNISGSESERVHEAYQKLGHLGGEARKQQMAEGEIFTKENPANPSQPPAGEQQRIENER